MGPERIKQYVEMGVKVWSGNDDDMHYCRHVLGAQGSISVAANVVPAMYRKMLHGPRNDSMNASLSPLFKWLFVQPNPIAINTVRIVSFCVLSVSYSIAVRTLCSTVVVDAAGRLRPCVPPTLHPVV